MGSAYPPYAIYSAASIVARYFSMFPAPSSHCQKSSPEPSGMSELVVVAAATGAAASHTARWGGGVGNSVWPSLKFAGEDP